jgi:hypothetical protein
VTPNRYRLKSFNNQKLFEALHNRCIMLLTRKGALDTASTPNYIPVGRTTLLT